MIRDAGGMELRGPATRGMSPGSEGERVVSWSGELLHIHIAPAASYEMEELREAQLVPGRGIVGDRYYLGTGTYSPKPDVREVTLIEVEVLEAIGKGEPSIPGLKAELAPADHRRNLTTRGVPANHLVGRRFRVGETVLRAARFNFPCKYLEELLGIPGLYEGLLNRSGLNCAIEVGGVIRPGDRIVPLDE
jgi:MOSC domain-containing protein YiiM